MERLTIRCGNCVGAIKPEDMGTQGILRKQAEYKALEEQGLLLRLPAPLDGVESFSLDGKDTWLRLPCKVGDKVYQIHTLPKSNRKVLVEAIADEFFITLCTLEKRFGKTVFLTKEEAESALEKMKGE